MCTRLQGGIVAEKVAGAGAAYAVLKPDVLFDKPPAFHRKPPNKCIPNQ
jgi:hypothetical protein